MIVVTLERAICRGVTIQTARAGENGGNGAERLQALSILSRRAFLARRKSKWQTKDNSKKQGEDHA